MWRWSSPGCKAGSLPRVSVSPLELLPSCLLQARHTTNNSWSGYLTKIGIFTFSFFYFIIFISRVADPAAGCATANITERAWGWGFAPGSTGYIKTSHSPPSLCCPMFAPRPGRQRTFRTTVHSSGKWQKCYVENCVEGNCWVLHIDFNGVFHTAERPESDPMLYFLLDVT